MKACVAISILLAAMGLAVEPVSLPLELGTFKTLDNKVYEEAKVVGSDAVGINLIHAGGTARISFDRLPKELAAEFAVSPEAAAAQLRKEAADASAHEREMAAAMKENGVAAKKAAPGEDEYDEETWEPESLPSVDHTPKAERIKILEAYIARAKATIEKMEKEADRMNASVARARAKEPLAEQDLTNNRERGNFRHARANKQREKIAELHRLMKTAEREIISLR